MKKIVALILIIMTALPVTAYANSAPTRWKGTDANGIVTMDKDCPITVEKEVLTFNISKMPTQYHGDIEQFEGDNFVAEYTLHNPTDMDITATVLFPFGKKGDYFSDKYITDRDFVKNNYKVMIDGKETEKEIRYTFCPDEFRLSEQLPKISDEFIGDKFFSPDQKITIYSIELEGKDKAMWLCMEWKPDDGKTKLYTTAFRGVSSGDGRHVLSRRFFGEGELVYCLIGDNTNRPHMYFMKEDKVVDVPGVDFERDTKVTEMTLREFVNKYYSQNFENLDITQTDIDNIVRDVFEDMDNTNQGNDMLEGVGWYNIPADLLCWYKYDITIPAGGTVTNTVTAPLFPDVNTRYKPDIYTYNYLVSPAGRWAGFKNMEIVINTPYYITETNYDSFEKTETGYKSTFENLPEKELVFTISESENPGQEKNINLGYLPLYAVLIGVPALGVIAVMLALKKKE